jgi:hypothetical protein
MQVEPRSVFSVNRLTVPVPGVREFQQRYEALVPDLPLDQVKRLVDQRAAWADMVELINQVAPYEFLIYFRNDEGPVMRAAGNNSDCVAYLMGNHVIAETMFRHDPRAMLYAPLRTLIWEDPSGDAWFTVDQPSSQFGSLGPQVGPVGRYLDHKLEALLEALDAPISQLIG